MTSVDRDPRWAFHAALNCAIATGTRTSCDGVLSELIRAAIDTIADEHPDASADDITYACDVFAREQL